MNENPNPMEEPTHPEDPEPVKDPDPASDTPAPPRKAKVTPLDEQRHIKQGIEVDET